MSRTVIYPAGIARFFASSRGIAGLIQKKADLIESNARVNIQITFEEGPHRTRDLETKLRQIPFQRDGVFHIAVGSDAEHGEGRPSGSFPYARALETGINPLNGAPMATGKLAFMVPAVLQAGFKPR